jgi:hypothetical protein
MAGVSETIVKEFFELNDFLVRQFRKYVAPAGRDDDDFDFLVINPDPQPAPADRPFVLTPGDLARIERAVVVVKPWHRETFSPSFLESTPELVQFVEKKTFQRVVASFGAGRSVLKILVVPALPHDSAMRAQSIALLRSKGVDAVISFPTLLTDLIEKVEANRNYQKSDLLQMIRILKNYEFIREPQLELFKGKRTRSPRPKTPKSATE